MRSLQYAQELHLHRQRHIADIVKEDCSAVCNIEKTSIDLIGSGKGTLEISEQGWFPIRVSGNAAATDRDESISGAWRTHMHGRATSSFPVLLSPRTRDCTCRGGDRSRTVCFSFSMVGLEPMILSSELRRSRIAAFSGSSAGRLSFSSTARLMASLISSTRSGVLRMYSVAPPVFYRFGPRRSRNRPLR